MVLVAKLAVVLVAVVFVIEYSAAIRLVGGDGAVGVHSITVGVDTCTVTLGVSYASVQLYTNAQAVVYVAVDAQSGCYLVVLIANLITLVVRVTYRCVEVKI